MPSQARYSITLRAQAVSLRAHGFSWRVVGEKTGMKVDAVKYWYKKAKERGFNPEVSVKVLDEHVSEGKRTGRPKEVTPEIEEAVIVSVTAAREKSTRVLASEFNISATSVQRILRYHGFHSVKPITTVSDTVPSIAKTVESR